MRYNPGNISLKLAKELKAMGDDLNHSVMLLPPFFEVALPLSQTFQFSTRKLPPDLFLTWTITTGRSGSQSA